MPSNQGKYAGQLTKKGLGSWHVQFRNLCYKESRTFEWEEEAEAYKTEVNTKEKLTKNIIYEHNNEYYCVLTQQKLMKFSFQDLHLVEKCVWVALRQGYRFYAVTNVNNDDQSRKSVKFHQLLLDARNRPRERRFPR
jgi:hypothetical protein